jgi:hypothetical protein
LELLCTLLELAFGLCLCEDGEVLLVVHGLLEACVLLLLKLEAKALLAGRRRLEK